MTGESTSHFIAQTDPVLGSVLFILQTLLKSRNLPLQTKGSNCFIVALSRLWKIYDGSKI